MKGRHLILVVLCLSLHLQGQVERDKVLHFVGGGLFGLAGAGVAKNATDGNRTWTFVGAVAGSALAGVAKEAIDASQSNNSWDNEDVLATVLGGIAVGLAIELFSKKKAGRHRYSRGAIGSLQLSQPLLFFDTFQITSNTSLPKLTPFGFSSNILNDMEHLSISSSLP